MANSQLSWKHGGETVVNAMSLIFWGIDTQELAAIGFFFDRMAKQTSRIQNKEASGIPSLSRDATYGFVDRRNYCTQPRQTKCRTAGTRQSKLAAVQIASLRGPSKKPCGPC